MVVNSYDAPETDSGDDRSSFEQLPPAQQRPQRQQQSQQPQQSQQLQEEPTELVSIIPEIPSDKAKTANRSAPVDLEAPAYHEVSMEKRKSTMKEKKVSELTPKKEPVANGSTNESVTESVNKELSIDTENSAENKDATNNVNNTKNNLADLMNSVKDVEDRVKERQQIRLVIVKIEVNNLPSAHRFTQNLPWLKASYGPNISWVADYQEGHEGEKAGWNNLEWAFNLERNEKDRNDLVIVVCSQKLIIGKYVLSGEEFSDIPDTDSGHFEVTGAIMNGKGHAGTINFICRKEVAERPKAPPKAPESPVARAADGGSSPLMRNSSTFPMTPTSKVFLKKINVRIMSMAVVDLKSVHFMEPNSPSISIVAGDWTGITDVAKTAGMAARWNNLNWKFTVDPENGIMAAVHSNAKFIGKGFISFDEILATQPNDSGFTEIIRHVINGKEITGRMKIVMVTKRPNTAQYDNIEQMASTTNDFFAATGSPMGSPKGLLPNIIDEDDDLGYTPSNINVPFVITIKDISVLDTPKVHVLQKNSLSIHAACGSWGGSTEEIPNSGQFASWINLKWSVLIKETSSLRITVWSRGVLVGASTLSVAKLQEQPVDYQGNTDIYFKILNEKNIAAGNVKIACKYKPYVENSPGKFTLPRLVPEASAAPNTAPALVENHIAPSELELPFLAILKSIFIFDTTAVHALVKNSPKVQVQCDRKCALTDVQKMVGSSATWKDLNWPMKVRADTSICFTVLSGSSVIGRLDITPTQMISLPLATNGCVEINTTIDKAGISTGKIKVIYQLKNLNRETAEEYKIDPGSTILPERSIDELSNTFPGANNSMTSTRFGNTSKYNNTFMDSVGPGSPNFPMQGSASMVFDRNMVSAAKMDKLGFSLHMVVHEIDVMDLKAVHAVAKNSPFVAAACGKWTKTTPPLINAGAAGYWTNLHWRIDMKGNSNLRFVVNSKKSLIGTAQFLPDDLFKPKPDEKGMIRMVGRLMERGEATGKIKVAYTMEILKETRILNSLNSTGLNRSMSSDSIPRNSPSKLLGKGLKDVELGIVEDNEGVEEEVIYFPFTLIVIDLLTIELKPVHKLLKNVPIVKAIVDQSFQETPFTKDTQDTMEWKNLKWKFVMKEESELKIAVESRSVSIGKIILSGEDVRGIPRNQQGIREIVLNLKSDGFTTGKIRMFYKLTQTVENYNPYDQMRVGDYNGKPTSARPQSAALSRPSSSPLVGSASGISNIVVPEDPLNSLREEYVPPSQRDQQQRPASKKPSTEPIPEEKAETSARPSFFSGLLGFSKKEPEPTGFEDANIQTNASSNVPPISNRPLSAVTNTTTPYGAVSSSQQSTAREPRSMPNTPMAVSSAPGSRPPSGNKFEALIQEQASFKKDDVYGDILRFKISAISVIDLKPAHQFSKNSPYINIACGRFVSMTEPIEGSGARGSWDNTNFEFNFSKKTTLRVLVASKSKTIGSCNLPRTRLLAGRKDEEGVFTLFVELTNNTGKQAGKMKLIYEILGSD